ncbi:MAG TPA: ligase-associated DNA damage response exonuclease [Longimicrobiaceae bacterium]|jgi:putative mRNA 3-end processing factor|nr:ligase-associated DNA damage response exonuclease [Longimicrobiaceae bacterium]
MLRLTERGLFCEAGDFYIDPWQPVDRAVITHAHGDHLRWGCRRYLGSREGERVMRTRLGSGAHVQTVEYGQALTVRGVRISLHPAGHILGSAQVRVEHRGHVWVVSGDYKTEPDPTCTPFEPVRCHGFVTESTFGLPIYRWAPQQQVFDHINAWWRANQEAGKASVLFGYALGKAQRMLAGLDPSIGPIFAHGATEKLNRDYRASGVELPPSRYVGEAEKGTDWSRAMILAPPSANGTPWMRRFGAVSTGFGSGWMRIRGARRRRSVDRGFVLSDHVDWPSLLASVDATGAETVWVTHGYREPVVRWLRDRGLRAEAIASRWEGESDEADVAVTTDAAAADAVADETVQGVSGDAETSAATASPQTMAEEDVPDFAEEG